MTDERNQQSAGPGGGEEFSPGLDLGIAPAPPPSAAPAAYRVLARKYRPASFDDLIGQDAMVRTLANAFRLDRIHQAYMLTGVRGVGKTTTARILARAFNYELPARDGHPAVNRPTIDMPEPGVHCQAIIDSRHIDVIEMDAASHTGVDDVREIIENARFKPVLARTKVYIIDEVHMLSRNAFNALLKTLEEPPEHVKFLFATTEIEKVPVTVRSRCQRFDLRRIDSELMIKHLAGICAKEGVGVEPEALAIVARAAEGSVRDALSLLDQAIATGANAGAEQIHADIVRDMLGSADSGSVIDLFESVMKGELARAMAILKEQYDKGADPSHVLTGLAEFIHLVTRLKIVPELRMDMSMTPEEFTRGREFARGLTLPALTRAWQILTKGLQELKDSARPLAAGDMVLVRLACAVDLPSPEDVLKKLSSPQSGENAAPPRGPSGGGGQGASAALRPQAIATAPGGAMRQPAAQTRAEPVAAAEPRVKLARFEDLVTLAQVNRDIQLKIALENDVRLVRFEQGTLEFSLVPGASTQLAQTLMRRLQEWTGARWMVAISREEGQPSIREQTKAREQERLTGVRADPLVRSVLERFPGAEIVAIRAAEPEIPPTAAVIAPETADAGSDEVGYADQFYTEDDL